MVFNQLIILVATYFIIHSYAILVTPQISATSSCPSVLIKRKEIRDLNPSEWSLFVTAVKKLGEKHGPSSLFDEFSKMHLDNAEFAHGIPDFLPWHRFFLWWFELELRKIDPQLSVPYWDWSLDSQAPERSIVFSDAYFGGNGVGNDECVRNGAFANFQSAYPTPHCLQRSFDGGSKLSAFYSTEALEALKMSTNDYDTFRNALEAAPHAMPHINIGGDMSTMHSPNDPIFYLHHAFVDKIWSEWQSKNGGQLMGSYVSSLAAQKSMIPFNQPVERVLFYKEALCYEYEESKTKLSRLNLLTRNNNPVLMSQFLTAPNVSSPSSEAIDEEVESIPTGVWNSTTLSHIISPWDRSEMLKVRIPTPAKSDFLAMNRVDEGVARIIEGRFYEWFIKWNQLLKLSLSSLGITEE